MASGPYRDVETLPHSHDSVSDGAVDPAVGTDDLGVVELPPPGTRRWVTRRKAQVVDGVRTGLITLEEACRRYDLSVEEFLSWQRLVDQHGVSGLRTTRLQEYRRPVGASQRPRR